MKLNGKIFGLVLAGLVLLPGCGARVPNYKPKSLDSIKSFNSTFTYRETKNNVTLGITCLNDEAKSYLFNDRNILLDGEKIEVLHISVHNLSADRYVISSDEIGITQIPYLAILKSIKSNSTAHLKKAGKVGGSVWGTLSGLTFSVFYFPVLLGFAGDKFGIGLAITLGSIGVLWPIVALLPALPFLGKAIKSAVMNGRINKDLREKMLHKDMIIKSGDKYEGLIFVKESDYNPQFSVTLPEKNNRYNSIVFDVNLQQE